MVERLAAGERNIMMGRKAAGSIRQRLGGNKLQTAVSERQAAVGRKHKEKPGSRWQKAAIAMHKVARGSECS